MLRSMLSNAHMLQTVSRLAAALCGASALYAAFFLYEDAKGNVQNRLEDWWIQLEESRTVAFSAQATFMQRVARTGTHFLDELFGERLLSVRAAGVSVCCSIVSMVIFDLIMGGTSKPSGGRLSPLNMHRDPHALVWPYIICFGIMAAYVALLFLLRRSTNRLALWLALIVTFILAPLPWLNATLTNEDTLIEVSEFIYPLILISIAFDLGFIVATRVALRWCSDSMKVWKIAGIISLNLAIALLLFLGPYSLRPYAVVTFEDVRIAVYGTIASMNIIDALIAVIFLLIMTGVLVHRLLWPLINRTVYALQALGIARRSLLLGSCGSALLIYAIWGNTEALSKIFVAFGRGG
jgi:hypothetical protein